ncbi:MAG: glycosyltransferase N-terminal domain-containing protein, partial [Bacteroidota bacterium]
MIRVLYTFCIQLYKGATYIAAIFNQKAKKRIEGIKTSKVELEDFIRSNQKELVFLHCASQGEHEQAKPLIRWILEKTDVAIILSFFSPSGYENADYLNNDRVLKIYLPFDTPKGISKLLSIIRPKTAILIKNEWWWNLIYKLKELTIPAYLVSATIRRHHYFIKYPFCFFAEGMRSFSTIFVIDKESEKIISTISSSNVHCVRDTRIDQVNYIKRRIKTKLGSTRDLQLKPVIIYGSIWEQDLKSIQVMIDQFPNHIHLIYPHLLNEEALQAIQSSIHNSKIVQHAKEATVGVNIISSMGDLKYAYQLADIAY